MMHLNNSQKMEDEMSRFEAEIAAQTAISNQFSSYSIPSYDSNISSVYIPHDKKSDYDMFIQQSAVVTAKPALYVTPKAPPPGPPKPTVDFVALQSDIEKKLKKLKHDKVSAELAISQGKASSALQAFGPDGSKKKGNKQLKTVRTAGGQTWDDHSLVDWPDDDFRIFCGDLGNDVTDELLFRTFSKYPSFQKAKVIRDKRTNKTKGYGFISFKDPADFTKAIKEMNGRYVGSRPIKLRKSTWRNRCIDIVKKKEKEKVALISMLTSTSGSSSR